MLSYFHATVADLIVVMAIIVIINMDINVYKRHRNQEKQWLRTHKCVSLMDSRFVLVPLPCLAGRLTCLLALKLYRCYPLLHPSTRPLVGLLSLSFVCPTSLFFCGVGLKLFHQLLAITLRDMYVIKPKSQVSLRTPCNMKNFKYIWNRKSWMINCSTSNDREISRGANSRFKRCMYMQLKIIMISFKIAYLNNLLNYITCFATWFAPAWQHAVKVLWNFTVYVFL